MLKPSENRDGEKNELVFRGPFGGIQSEIPSHLCEQFQGFNDAVNVVFKNGMATVRPGFTPIAALPPGGPAGERGLGIISFYNSSGVSIQTLITQRRLFKWQGVSLGWLEITKSDGALTGGPTDQFTYDSVGYKLCFCQGIDKVQLWDGITATYAVASANAPIAKYLCEIANHLMTGFITVGGNTFPQRFVWSASGDATDWTSFTSGTSEQLNNFGSISGIIKLNQNAFGFQQKGILTILPTGIGTDAFRFYPFGARARGNIAPLSLDVYNETLAFYLGNDNVYMFTGSSCEPIGSAPIQGRMRYGAWSRIHADIQVSDLTKIIGVVTTSVNGVRFNAYWLFIPNVSCWVYHIDEGNWTRFTFGATVSRADFFSNNGVVRIMDLVGTIAQQNWTPSTLNQNNPLDNFLISFTDGTNQMTDFSNFSEQPWSLTLPQLCMNDLRHEKSVNALRIVYQDLGNVSLSITIKNEKGESRTPFTNPVTFGTGTGNIQTVVVTFPKITGMFISPLITGVAGIPFSASEITPFYITGGEYKQNVV